RDQRHVDRADRDAGVPVRPHARFMQALVDAGLVGAERAAALQHERHGLVVRQGERRDRLVAHHGLPARSSVAIASANDAAETTMSTLRSAGVSTSADSMPTITARPFSRIMSGEPESPTMVPQLWP